MMDALDILREDAQRLTPQAARVAQFYVLADPALADWWRSALSKTLHERAGAVPVPRADALLSTLGKPGAWLPPAYHHDATDMRCWLAAVQAMAQKYAPPGPRPHA